MQNIVIFGGTFNPVHIGHIEMLSELNSLSYVDKIIIMPSKIPPHKDVDFLADESHRASMCEIAARMFSKVTVSTLELMREGKSYTIDTIRELLNIYKGAKIYITIGGDMLLSFKTWNRYEEIIKHASIICFNRGNCDISKVVDSIAFLRKKGADITLIDKKITDVSSTYLRENIDKHEILKKFIPREILDFINKNSVYGG